MTLNYRMERFGLWSLFTALTGLLLFSCSQPDSELVVDNPYEGINWEDVQHLHGGSHMHTRSPEQWEEIYRMGIRHLSLSNYYPSEPTWPLSDEFMEGKEDLVTAPNAEQHGSTDHSLHFNTIGSFYTTGYGRGFSTDFDVDWSSSPFDYRFTDLHRFNPESDRAGEGVYRLDLRRDATDGAAPEEIELFVTLEGALECDHGTFETIGDGQLDRRRYTGDQQDTIYFCVTDDQVRLQIDFDPATTRIDRIRVMQGTNRPWRVAFREVLDGDRRNDEGQSREGLLYEDGGGIIINHPRHPVSESLEMLDFDDRVLGVEVWNHRRWFGLQEEAPHMRYYDHWDEILRTGRRAYGFFVKDHRLAGRGRNILLVPSPEGRSREGRRRDALRAYRQGQLYGLLGAWDRIDEDGRVQQPYDHSHFSFQAIELVRSEEDRPVAIRVRVDGHDTDRRPNLQIRFISDQGVEAIVNGQQEALFEFTYDRERRIGLEYVRVEAFAYPETHLGGEELTTDMMEEMNVYEIARIHDRLGFAGNNDVDEAGKEPIGTVDMLFSQPIRFIQD